MVVAVEDWQLRVVPREAEQVEVGFRMRLKHSRFGVGEERMTEVDVDSETCLFISVAVTSCNIAIDTTADLKVLEGGLMF